MNCVFILNVRFLGISAVGEVDVYDKMMLRNKSNSEPSLCPQILRNIIFVLFVESNNTISCCPKTE